MKRLRRILSLSFYDRWNLAELWLQRLKGVFLYRWVFKYFGYSSALYPPMLIGNPRFIHIGDRVTIRKGVRLEAVISKPGREPVLTIGNNVLIEQHVHIVCHSRIDIGSNVCIAGHCAIFDVNHPVTKRGPSTNRDPSINVGHHILDIDSPVEIGDGVFIGFGTVILPGVRIGECAVIGANSVVTRDIPAYSTAAGAPAIVLRTDLRAAGALEE